MITNFELFTGKNEDKEVCLGSIIKHNNNIYIAWFVKNWGLVFINEKTFDYPEMLKNKHQYREYNWMYRVRKHVEILGNIHENSDILS